MASSKKLRLAFMGTPDFTVSALEALVKTGHEVVYVYTQPPRPKGRGHQLQKTPVHEAAEKMGIPVRTPKSLKASDAQAEFAALKLDAAVVFAYSLLLPKAVLDAPRLGCVNIHPSLLPRWRGAAPIIRALLEGDQKTGVTIMQMDEGLDTGPMWLKREYIIPPKTTAALLQDTLGAMGSAMIVEVLEGIVAGRSKAEKQPEDGVVYAAKLAKEDGFLEWVDSAEANERKVRALNPWPGVSFESRGERIKILEAELFAAPPAQPGMLLNDDLAVACGQGALKLLRVQRPGRGSLDGASFLRGFPVKAGEVL